MKLKKHFQIPKHLLLALTLILAPIFTLLLKPSTSATPPTTCNSVRFIFARGSGESLNDTNYQAFKSAIDNSLKNENIQYGFYELGSASQNGHQYPATAVGIDTAKQALTTLGALVSAGESHKFGQSVQTGIEELKSYINTISRVCPDTKFVIGGYSQGGMVISKALPSLDPKKILYAATFGDPKLLLPEGKGKNPPACRGQNLSPYRVYVPDCETYEGILGGLDPYQPTTYTDQLGVWCQRHDIMCSSYINPTSPIQSHLEYAPNQLYVNAALYIKLRLHHLTPPTTPLSLHDAVILIDSTGSMTDLIDKYKSEAKRLASEIKNSGGRIALYEFRDLNGPFKPVAHCHLDNCSLETFQQKIDQIKTNGGGDTPESALSATLTALNSEPWQVGAKKSLILLTDAPYHLIDRDGTNLPQVIKRSLEIDPVNFYPITPAPISSSYQELATATGGKAFDSAGALDLSTEYILTRPDPVLPLPEYSGLIGDEFTFDASASTASSKITSYAWDLDGDGAFESTSDTPIIHKTYSAPTDIMIQLKITDENGLFGTMSAHVVVKESLTPTAPLTAQISYPSDTTAKISLDQPTHKTLLVINGALLGELTTPEILITDLDRKQNNQITLIAFDTSGARSTPLTFSLPIKNSTPTTSETSTSAAHPIRPLKAPKTGTLKSSPIF